MTADTEPQKSYGVTETSSNGERVIHPSRDDWYQVAAALLDDGWTMCSDLTAVDFSAYAPDRNLPSDVTPERFEVVASFLSFKLRDRIRARIQVPSDDPSIPSIYPLYPGSDFAEREVYDLFGITFDGHPDLSRIMMPETWEGHPLRKDYETGSIPVQFKNSADAEKKNATT